MADRPDEQDHQAQAAESLVGLVDAVLFDFAGVLTTTPTILMAERARMQGIPFAEAMPLMIGPRDADTDHPWHRIERGEISLDEFMTAAGKLFTESGYEAPVALPTSEEVVAALAPIPEMLDVVARVRAAGLRTAILSNNIREWSAWRGVVNARDVVDLVVDSSDVGMRKPNPAIFQLVADRLGPVPPERCLMIDDFAWNLPGAESLGMFTYHVTDPVDDAKTIAGLLGLNR